MSGYPSGSGGGNDKGLDNLFAQLRQQQTKPVTLEPAHSYYSPANNLSLFNSSQSQQPGYQQPSVYSPAPTPTAPGPQPHHTSAIMSPVDSPQPRIPIATGGTSDPDRTSSLLSLLKFSQPTSTPANQAAPSMPPLPPSREVSGTFSGPERQGSNGSASAHGRGNSDLLAALMGNVQPKQLQHPPRASPQFATSTQGRPNFAQAPTSPPADTQAYLLQLLNQPKPSPAETTPQLKQTKVFTPPSKPSSQEDDVGDLTQTLEEASLNFNLMGSAASEGVPSFSNQETQGAVPKSLFTYVNPFEQLAASSPRNRTPKNEATAPPTGPPIQILKHPRHESPADSKHKSEEANSSSPAHTKRKLDVNSQASSASPTPLPDGRTPLEALIGIGASKETVHDALNDISDQVDKQAQEAIARSERDESQAAIERDLRDMLASKTEAEFEQTSQIAARAIKKELDKEENSAVLDSLPTPVAEDVKGIIEETAHGHIADSWESADADDSPLKEEDDAAVTVYNFPIAPWTSIALKDSGESRPMFRDEVIMDIARVKKEFDQVDRTLVTASNNFIAYGMSKHGGFRIIRQDDGKDTRLFTDTQDRIFNVAISASTADLKESIIGTGISGTVYWALIKDGTGDHVEDSTPETYGFALPPLQSHDNDSPGGVLKTRARKSSTHPDFFAVGRGKYIHIVWPGVILRSSHLKKGKDRIVDTDKYLNHQCLKVNTGKAGKDFTFSEDDTTIVSLDKAGRVKFWDVRRLTTPENSTGPSSHKSLEIKEPLVTFITTPATEKSWPTSVLFVDKLRPYQRGGPLRYLIVGMKQNHTLQLWDLALGKPVQEIHLPHGKESDAVCSVTYQAASGMIVVGHPTRNSVYFLHLSAPKYNHPKITQAEYMEKLASNDPSFPKPVSTAVISGMREYSFGNKGHLRSLDILQTPNSTAIGSEPITLFEIYAMHSKGVTCVNIKQAELGWGLDNKVIRAEDASKASLITISTLKEIPATPVSEVGDPTPQTAVPTRIVPRPAPKEASSQGSPKKATNVEPVITSAKNEDKIDKKENNRSNNSTNVPAEKKKRRKGTNSSDNVTAGSSATQNLDNLQPKSVTVEPSSNSRQGNSSKPNLQAISESSPLQAAGPDFTEASLKNIETRVASEVKRVLGDSMGTLNQTIKSDRRLQSEVFEAKQDAMLRIVSSTLSDNIEASLGKIVASTIEESVIPAVSKVSVKAVNDHLGSKLNSQIAGILPKELSRELQKTLPDAIGKALQQPQLLKLMSEALAKSVAFNVEEQFATMMHNTVTPAFKALAVQTSQRVASDVQRQAAEQVNAIQQQRNTDSIKIEQLTQLVTGLTEHVASMASAQSDFQAEFLRMQKRANAAMEQAANNQTAGNTTERSISGQSSALARTAPAKTAEEIEFDEMMESITQAMNAGEFESAVIRWLQTRREQEFFELYFADYNPGFVRNLSPLLLLSLGATVSVDIDGPLMLQRVAWLEAILAAFQNHVIANNLEPQVVELIPKIMGIYVQRVEHLFMRISQLSAHDPMLKNLSLMVTGANRIIENTRESMAPRHSLGGR